MLAERHAPQVRAERQRQFAVVLAIVRLELARRRGDLELALREVGPLLEPVEADSVTELTLSNDARAVALMNLGIVELWSFRLDDAERHLEQSLALARLIDRPYVQIGCLSHLGLAAARHSLALARQRSLEAIAIAEAHGWATDPIASTALAMMASAEVAQGRFEEGGRWLDRAERSIRAEPDPATALFVHFVRGELHVGEGRLGEALGEFRAAAQLQDVLATSHALTGPATVSIAQTQLGMGDIAGARATVASLTERDHEFGEARTAIAAIRLAEGNDTAAAEALASVLDGTLPVVRAGTVIQALMLDAIARDQLGDHVTAERDIERALDIAEPDSLVFPLMVVPARDLLERHPRHRTAHAALLADLLTVLAGSSLPSRGRDLTTPSEPLSESELRVLRFLPSNLSAGEIAGQLYVSTSTVKTHMRHIYEKLDAHRRTEAVDRARELGCSDHRRDPVARPTAHGRPGGRAHTIRWMCAHPASHDVRPVDEHFGPTHYVIRVRGVLSDRLLTAFPGSGRVRIVATPFSRARCPTRRRCMGSWRRSRRSGSSSSRSVARDADGHAASRDHALQRRGPNAGNWSDRTTPLIRAGGTLHPIVANHRD